MSPVEELEPYLRELHSHIRLSMRSTRFTTARMEQFLRKVDVSSVEYRQWSGNQGLQEFIAANPTWSLRAWQVLILECAEVIKRDGKK